jgi:hypothetical protein
LTVVAVVVSAGAVKRTNIQRRGKYVAAAVIALSVVISLASPGSVTAAPQEDGRSRGSALPDPGRKAASPVTNLADYPKLTTDQLADRVSRDRTARGAAPATEPTLDVISTQTLPDGTVRVDTYTPAPGVTAEQLAASLREQGKVNVVVDRHVATEQTDPHAAGADDCSYGQARSVTCPVSYWTNMTRANPVVVFNDHAGAQWPTDNAVYKWNTTPNIDSWYRWNYCPQYENVHCVDVHSANYGATGWYGNTTHYYVPPLYGRIVGAHVELNDYYGTPGTTRNAVVTHELGHALGLGHNMWSGDVMYYANGPREDIGGENPALLASIYSVTR